MKKKHAKKYIAWICIVALVAVLAVMPLLAGSKTETDGPQASILSGNAENRDVHSLLLGGGTLIAEEAMEITVPAAVKLTEFLVSNGDAVSAGEPIASVDRVSVMSAITEVQETLEYLAEEIDTAAEDEVSGKVTARAGGIVKILYAAEGDSVQDVMIEHGALAVLSLDGLMAVAIQHNADVEVGDSVVVGLEDGESSGRVEANLDGTIVITVSDDGYEVGQQVSVTTEDGQLLGTGALYIHSPWNAVGYSGTVSAVKVGENETVSAGDTLMTLEDTGYTATSQQLIQKHREYEELMLELFRMYQSTVVTAPCDGVVSGIDEDSTQLLGAGSQSWTIQLLANAPNGDDETRYQNFVGRVTAVGIDGLILKMNPRTIEVTDYTDLSGIPMEFENMTEEVIYDGEAPIYEQVAGAWVRIEMKDIAEGDVLLFAGDAEGNFVWIVRVPVAEEEIPEEPAPSEPEEPAQPEETQPSQQENPEDTQSSASGMDMSGMGEAAAGIWGGFIQGGVTQQERFEEYSLETVTIASVTAQDTMTVEITVDELDISSIFVDQEVAVTVDALSGESFVGFVSDIGSDGISGGGNSKFTVEVTLPRGENMLAGMNAAVTVTLGISRDVLTVPVEALVEIGTETVVYTGYDEEEETLTDPVAVTTGVSDGEYVQILSGLEAGAVFWYAYYDTLEISNAVESGGFGLFR